MNQSPLSLRGASHIAPDANYYWFDRDHIRRTTPLSEEIQARKALLNRIDGDMHTGSAEDNGEIGSYISSPWGMLSHQAFKIDLLVELILEIDNPAFVFVKNEEGLVIKLEEHLLGSHYYELLSLCNDDLGRGLSLDSYTLPPRVELFRDVLKPYAAIFAEAWDSRLHPAFKNPGSMTFLGERYNEFLDEIRTQAKVRNLTKIIAARNYSFTRTRTGMFAFLDRCFKKRRRLYCIRVDADYKKEFASGISIEQAKQDHKRFLNRLRGNASLSDVVVGAIWKLEWTEVKGHHFHWILFLDGALAQSAAAWANRFASLWVRTVADNAGYVHISNYGDYRKLGTGMIHVNDHEKVLILKEKVISYLAKKDQALCLKKTPGTRTWGTWTPGGVRTSKAGRPPKAIAVNAE